MNACDPIEESITELMQNMTRGQFLIFCDAIRQLGGEMQLDWRAFAIESLGPLPRVTVTVANGMAVLHLAECEA